MSDILIKNMEKPKACFTPLCKDSCFFHVTGDGRGNLCSLTGNRVKCNKVDKECPIVEVKPHGRLIDADKLRGEINYLICTDCEMESCEDCDVEWCKNIIENAPTVLEASPKVEHVKALPKEWYDPSEDGLYEKEKTTGKDSFDCSAPNCLDCERNDECNHIGLFEADE